MNDKRLFVAIMVLYLATSVQGTATFKVQVRHEGRVFNEVVKINVASNTETFHVPAQEGSDAAEVIHDFYKKLTMISLPEKHVCYVSQLSDNLPRPGKLVEAFKKAAAGATGSSDSNLERVETAMLVKELIPDRSNLSQAMRTQCQSFPIYRIEPVEDLISITPISNHEGASQSRVRRGHCSSSVCVKVLSCYPTCTSAANGYCMVCTEKIVCKDIDC